MQFKVPQDVQREDTIVGPLTLKQMIIIGIGGGLAYATYISLSARYFFEIWLPPVAILSILTVLFAFVKPNGQQFYIYVINLVEFNFLPKKRVWIQRGGQVTIPPQEKEKEKEPLEDSSKKKELTKSIEELSAILNSTNENSLIKKAKELNEQPRK